MEQILFAGDPRNELRKNVDAEYLEPLRIIEPYTMEIPEAGFHK